MFSLASGVYHWLFSRPEVCILLVGLQGSGKTTFFEQLKERYARSGSKGAGGTGGRGKVGNKLQAGPQDDHAKQQQHDRQQELSKRHQSWQQHTVEQLDTRPKGKKQKGDQQKQHEQRDLPPHHQQQHMAKNLAVVGRLRGPGTEQEAYSLPQVSSTTGLNFCRFRYQDVDVILWDLSGLASFHAIWVDYFQNAHCVLYFVDSTSSVEGARRSRTALNNLTSAAMTILRRKASDKEHKVWPPPLLIVAAKQDLARAQVPPPGPVRAAFCEEETCSISSGRGQRTQQRVSGDDCFSNECPHHRFQVGAVFSHSAYSWDSVEELLRRAVHAAKAYYELLSLPSQHFNPASTKNACVPPQTASFKLGTAGCAADKAKPHTLVDSEAAARKDYTLLKNSRPRPAHSGRRCGVASEFAQIVLHRRQTRNSTVIPRENSSGSHPVDPHSKSKGTNPLEVHCCHHATTHAASGAFFMAADPTYARSLKGSDDDASEQAIVHVSDAVAATTAGVDAPDPSVCDSLDIIVPFRLAAAQQAYQASGAASAQKAKLNRESSGFYELDDCM